MKIRESRILKQNSTLFIVIVRDPSSVPVRGGEQSRARFRYKITKTLLSIDFGKLDTIGNLDD